MRDSKLRDDIDKTKLRIPIRGYERRNVKRPSASLRVTNPYKGL